MIIRIFITSILIHHSLSSSISITGIFELPLLNSISRMGVFEFPSYIPIIGLWLISHHVTSISIMGAFKIPMCKYT